MRDKTCERADKRAAAELRIKLWLAISLLLTDRQAGYSECTRLWATTGYVATVRETSAG